MTKGMTPTWVLAGTVILLISLFAGLKLGAVSISFHDLRLALMQGDALYGKIIWQLRMPRLLLAFMAGGGLALAGMILQTVTRNPLADPYLFGISSGASFGVVLLITLTGIAHGMFLSLAAFARAMLAMGLLLLIAGRRNQIESLLLAGVALSFLFSAFTSLLLYYSDPQAVTAMLFWNLGSFARAEWSDLGVPGLIVGICIASMLLYRRQLNALLLGDESAVTLGVNVTSLRLTMLVLSALLTASLVAVSGGVGFVGLMIPHMVRFFISQGSAGAQIVCVLAGGVFMVWVDILARTVLPNQELPIGVITAAIGSLFFLALLYFRKRSW